MNRYRAAAIHLGLSATIASLVFVPIYFLWYPGALFDSAGGRTLFLLVLAVDVTIGPLITLIIFVPGKRGLVFDLWVIALMQLSALAYGVSVLAESRPVYLVFVKDRFELVRANQIPAPHRARAEGTPYADLSWTGPRIVAARFPSDPNEQFDLMMSGFAGVDIQSYPQYYVPYDTVRADASAKGRPIAQLATYNPGFSAAELARSLGRREDELRYLPVRAGKVDVTIVVDVQGEVLRIANLRPWEY